MSRARFLLHSRSSLPPLVDDFVLLTFNGLPCLELISCFTTPSPPTFSLRFFLTTSIIQKMMSQTPDSGLLGLAFVCTEAVFLALFAYTLLQTPSQLILKRFMGVLMLTALTYTMESAIVPICARQSRPHWAVTAASLLWVQLLSASELLLVSRVSAVELSSPSRSSISNARSAIGLLWNMRRIGTPWQVKNVPSTKGLEKQSRPEFIFRRATVTILAYLFVDFIASMPPPEPALVQPDKASLFPQHGLSIDDVIFRTIMTFSYFLTTAILNLFMTNVGAIFVVLTGLNKPTDCPPLYGSFSEAYTIRRFWGYVIQDSVQHRLSLLIHSIEFHGIKCSALSSLVMLTW